MRRSRRFDSWSASQSPFRQLECVSHYFSGRLEAMSACDDDRHFEILAELLHALKGHSPAIRSRPNAGSIPKSVHKAKYIRGYIDTRLTLREI